MWDIHGSIDGQDIREARGLIFSLQPKIPLAERLDAVSTDHRRQNQSYRKRLTSARHHIMMMRAFLRHVLLICRKINLVPRYTIYYTNM